MLCALYTYQKDSRDLIHLRVLNSYIGATVSIQSVETTKWGYYTISEILCRLSASVKKIFLLSRLLQKQVGFCGVVLIQRPLSR